MEPLATLSMLTTSIDILVVKQGVRSLAFLREHSILFSAGFEREIHVWDPVMGMSLVAEECIKSDIY
jgi:hypothetical protein